LPKGKLFQAGLHDERRIDGSRGEDFIERRTAELEAKKSVG
jgi:hypothetical protein